MPSFNQRVNTMLRTSGGTWYDPDTGEVMHPRGHQTKKNMSYPPYKNRSSKSFSLPNFDVSKVLNLMLIGGVGFLGYKLYNNFFGQSAIDKAQSAGVAALSKTYVSTPQATVNTLVATADSLKAKGLNVSTMHQNLANTLHGWLNSVLVPHDSIVKAILGMDVQTFRLVSSAYSTRDLLVYYNSPFHLLNSKISSAGGIFLNKNDTIGTLKEHLNIVLTDSELSKIHAYYSVI